MEDSRVVEYPKESLEIDLERILEDKRVAIGRPFGKLARRRRVGKSFPEKRRVSCKKIAMDTI
jgi:hypothetical protein